MDTLTSILGAANSVFQNTPLFSEQYKYTPFLYFQDDWRATNKLTLNLGLRWEPYITTRDRFGHDGAFRPGQQSIVYPLGATGSSFPRRSRNRTRCYPQSLRPDCATNRFCLRPGGNGKTSHPRRLWHFLRYTTASRGEYQPAESALLLTGKRLLTVQLSDPYANAQQTQQLLLNYVPPKTAADRASRVFYLPMTENTIAPNFTTGYIQQWNLTVQQEVWKQIVVTAAYLGAKGHICFCWRRRIRVSTFRANPPQAT